VLWFAVKLILLGSFIGGLAELTRRYYAKKAEAVEPLGGCPACASTDVEGALPTVEGLCVQQEVRCLDCGTRWISVYRWVRNIVTLGEEDDFG